MDDRPENIPSAWNRGFWLPPEPRPIETIERPSDSPSVVPDHSSSIRPTYPTPAA